MSDEKAKDRGGFLSLLQFSAAELEELERDLSAGNVAKHSSVLAMFDETLEEIAEAQAVRPPAGLKARLLDKIRSAEDPIKRELPSAGLLALVRVDGGKWKPTRFPGVDAKLLFADKPTGNTTYLLRMQPGSVYPRHKHAAPEQCLVIEGEVQFEDYSLAQGDYTVSGTTHVHPACTTRDGCLLLIINNERDEILD